MSRSETSGHGALAAILNALERNKAIVPTEGGVLIELDAYSFSAVMAAPGSVQMVCDADDVAALYALADPTPRHGDTFIGEHMPDQGDDDG